ncbi:MAG: ribosome recycling factor [Myxococcota bacterium]|nr:ribosome recycling factor [Myxococcota bacterium]
MTIEEECLDEFSLNIEETKESLVTSLKKLRTGRANVAILDGIRLDYYGSSTQLSQCAQLSAPEPRLLLIKPWEKTILGDIEKAIMTSELGLNPQNDGEVIRLPIPQLTEERRKDLVKQAKARGEEAKISIRNHRRSINDMLKDAEKEKEMSQDDLKRSIDKVQQATNTAVESIDQILKKKEEEILAI